jgi:hypothetical protein
MRFLILVTIALLASCTQHNPNVCCTDQADCDAQGLPLGSTCAQGLLCRGNQCIAETCSLSAECDLTAPFCVNDLCTSACIDDAQCPGFQEDPADRFCVGGACVACREGMADCPMTAPVCDTGACRGCVIDDDCASRVCTTSTGVCVDTMAILYVSPDGLPGNDCSLVAPCTMATAVTLLGVKKVIRMLPGTYAVDVSLGVGASATIIGTGATLTGSVGTGPIVTTDASSNVTIRGLTIHTTSGLRSSIQCSGTAAAMLALADVVIDGGSAVVVGFQAGLCHLALSRTTVLSTVDISNASTGTIDRSNIQYLELGSGKGAIVTVTNSIVSSFSLPRFDPYSASGRVSFSTIGGSYIDCETNAGFGAVGFLFDNDILVATLGSPASHLIGNAACFDHDIAFPQAVPLGTNMKIIDPHFVDAPNNDFHLLMNSAAIDAADPAATDPVDYDGIARPQGAGRDLGAFEYH